MPALRVGQSQATPAQRHWMQLGDLASPSAAPATEGVRADGLEQNFALSRNLAQHLDTDLALRDLAQCGYGRLVARIDLRCVALRELARAIRCCEGELKTVRNLFQAIFDGDASHGGTFFGYDVILAERGVLVLSNRGYPIPNCVNNSRWRTF